jgi:Ca2+/H+ antiporter
MGGAALLVAVLIARGRSSSWFGAVLVAAYIVAAVIFYKAGGR